MSGPIPKTNMFLMKKFFLWPKTGGVQGLTRRFYVTAFVVYGIISGPIFEIMVGVFKHRTNEAEILVFNFNIIITYITFCLVFTIYMYNLKDIVFLAIDVEKMIIPDEGFSELDLEVGRYTKSCLLLVPILITVGLVCRIIDREACYRRINDTDRKYYCDPLIPSLIIPYAEKLHFGNVLIVFQLIVTILFYQTLALMYFMCVWVMKFLILRLRVLRQSLSKLVPGKRSISYQIFYAKFANAHSNIIRTGKVINGICYAIHFVHVTTVRVIIVVVVADFYMCEYLSQAVYDTEWYEMGVNVRCHVLMILQATQKPIYMYAGPLAYLSHATFLQLLKTVVSYWSIFVNLVVK